jgi:AraC family transcriptional regulator, arabinose operon regulatory protein
MRTDLFLAHHESGHYRYRQPWTTHRGSPVDFLVVWVLAGSMDLMIADRALQAGPGDLVLLKPEVRHTYHPGPSSDWEWLWLHFDGAGAREFWSRLDGGVGPVRPLGLDGHIKTRFLELVSSAAATTGTGPSIRLDTCACSLLGLIVDRLETGSEPGTASSRADIADLTLWVLNHLDRPLTLADLAREAGWSAAHLTRMTRQEVGLAPMQYVTRLRIRQAERLLRDTELAVSEVAAMVGFSDPLHFSRRFRQLSGRPPSRARVAGWSEGPGTAPAG